MLADIALDEAELVGEQERLAILAQRLPPVLVQRMDRHRKKAKLHGPRRLLSDESKASCAGRCRRINIDWRQASGFLMAEIALRQIRAIVAVVEEGSFTRAAARENATQS